MPFGKRDPQAECLSGVEIDAQLKPGRLWDRQIGGLGASLCGLDRAHYLLVRRSRQHKCHPEIKHLAVAVDRRLDALEWLRRTLTLLKRHFGKASELAGMQPLQRLRFQLLEGRQADLKMLVDTLPVEFPGHAGELDLSMQRFVRDAK